LSARVPVVTLAHVISGTEVDVSINNLNAISQSRTLGRLYSDHVRTLIMLVKLWARRRSVYGKARGRLGGFAFGQLAMFFSQVYEGPKDVPHMFLNFFRFYAEEFDWSRETVSVSLGRRVSKAFTESQITKHLSIEDMFDRRADLCAAGLLGVESEHLRVEFRRSSAILLRPNANLEELMQVCASSLRHCPQGASIDVPFEFRFPRRW